MIVNMPDWDDEPQERIVIVEDWDSYSANYTLAYIILPVLQQLRDKKPGSPFVSDDDVPDELKTTNALPKKEEWHVDSNWHKRWDYVLGEMIWAFENFISYDHDTNPDDEDMKRQQRGFELFGKYYESLWT